MLWKGPPPPDGLSPFWLVCVRYICGMGIPKRDILLYGIGAALLLSGLEAAQYRFMLSANRFEWYAAIVALVFAGIGAWVATSAKPNNQKTAAAEPPTPPLISDEELRQRLGISVREMDVLQLMAAGHSNEEIAERLFISTNTVKTHSSSLYGKLEVKRRTQAVTKAKEMGLIR